MKKRVILLLMTLALLAAMALPAAAVETAGNTQTMEALNALLEGVNYWGTGTRPADVAQWPQDTISEIMFCKLMKGSLYDANGYLGRKGITAEHGEIYTAYHLDQVQKLTMDAFGQAFSTDMKVGGPEFCAFYTEGDRVYVSYASGEMEQLVIQSFRQEGQTLIAVGTAVHHYSWFSQIEGTFKAEFRENPDSIYGYTLVRFEELGAAEGVGGLTASASSALAEYDMVHSADRALDGNNETAWVEGVSGTGAGEWIMLTTQSGASVPLSAIELDLGYHKTPELLARNGWPTRVRIECADGYSQESWFSHYDEPGVLVLDRISETSWVKITILDAQAGSHYDDTCITDIRLYSLDAEAHYSTLIPETTPGMGAAAEDETEAKARPSIGMIAVGIAVAVVLLVTVVDSKKK